MHLRLTREPGLPDNRLGIFLRLLAGLAVVGWLFAVLVSYYVFHKPLSLEVLVSLPTSLGNVFGGTLFQVLGAFANMLGDVFTFTAIILLAAVLGYRFSRPWTFVNALEANVIRTGIGLGGVSLAVFVLAALGIVNQWVYWAMLLASLIVLRDDLRGVWSSIHTISLPRPTRGDKALALFCALTLVVSFLFALTPPWSWDSLQYHLILPKLILEQGRIAPPPDNFSLSFPALVEMLFLAGMTLKGDTVAQGMHWIFLPLTLGTIMSFAQKYFSIRVGWIAAAIFCAMPSMIVLSTWAYNDLALVFYTFSAFAVTLRARETNRVSDFLLAGILCGLAMGEKYTAAVLPFVLSCILFRPSPTAIRNILLLLGFAALIAAPWFIRNWILVGNPVYPYVFGGPYWDSFRTDWNTRLGTGLWLQPFSLLIVPWTATVQGTQSGVFDANIGPLILVLLPWNMLRTPAKSDAPSVPMRAMWFFALVLYLVWLFGVAQSMILSQTRFLFPVFPLFAILAARGIEKLSTLVLPQFSVQRIAYMGVAIVLTITAMGYVTALLSDNAFGYFFGRVSRAEYLKGILGSHYITAEWVNGHLPADARVLFFWEPRSYYYAPNADGDVLLDRFAHLVYLYNDADAIADTLRVQGYTHVLLYREGLDNILQTGFDPVTDNDLKVLDRFFADELTPLYGTPALGLETRNGRFGLVNAQQEPYAIFELKP